MSLTTYPLGHFINFWKCVHAAWSLKHRSLISTYVHYCLLSLLSLILLLFDTPLFFFFPLFRSICRFSFGWMCCSAQQRSLITGFHCRCASNEPSLEFNKKLDSSCWPRFLEFFLLHSTLFASILWWFFFATCKTRGNFVILVFALHLHKPVTSCYMHFFAASSTVIRIYFW